MGISLMHIPTQCNHRFRIAVTEGSDLRDRDSDFIVTGLCAAVASAGWGLVVATLD